MSDPEVLDSECLQPLLESGRPGLIILAGAGLDTTTNLSAKGWVRVGSLPLMLRTSAPQYEGISNVRRLSLRELSEARDVLADAFGLDRAEATFAIPDSAMETDGAEIYGLFRNNRMDATVCLMRVEEIVTVWSMATRRDCQRQGVGRQLIHEVLRGLPNEGVGLTILTSSTAGEKLYLSDGFEVLECYQPWSRPRWSLAAS